VGIASHVLFGLLLLHARLSSTQRGNTPTKTTHKDACHSCLMRENLASASWSGPDHAAGDGETSGMIASILCRPLMWTQPNNQRPKTMPKDSCYKKVKAQYDVFPSARASQAIAKCRKGSGDTKKTEAGSDLKRWAKEKWVDQKTGKPCGSGGETEYCRPTKRVSADTPKTAGEMTTTEKNRKILEKSRVGMGQRVTPTKK
jgi:hypothetical protein